MFFLSFYVLALSSTNVRTGLFLAAGIWVSPPCQIPCFLRLLCSQEWSSDLDMWSQQRASGKSFLPWSCKRNLWGKSHEESFLFLFSAFEHNCLRTISGAQDDRVKDGSQHARMMKVVETSGLVVHAKLLVSRLTLCNPMDCSLPASSVRGLL